MQSNLGMQLFHLIFSFVFVVASRPSTSPKREVLQLSAYNVCLHKIV